MKKLYKIKKSNIDNKGLYASTDIKIGTKIINISVHSKGQPSKNIINCVITRNCHGAIFIDLKKCSKTSCPPKYENTDANVQDPMNNHIIIAVVFAVKKTDSLKFFHLSVL